ncbi:MAG: ATPase, T2SS/T4P/T4SS family, partial [Panacagrimonas sp.]
MDKAIKTPGKVPDPAGEPGGQMAKILLDQRVLTRDQLDYALRVRSKLGEDYSLVRVLKDLEYLSDTQLRDALRAQGRAVPIGNLLVELGYLRPAELSAALKAQKEPQYKGMRLGEFLLEKRLIQERELIEVLADQLGFPNVEARFSEIAPELLSGIRPDWCRRFSAVPLSRDADKVMVAFVDPLDQNARLAAEDIFIQVVPAITSRRALDETVTAFENSLSHAGGRDAAKVGSKATALADMLILEALKQGASDIHIEPTRTRIRVRFRCDGVLQVQQELDSELLSPLSNRLKVLASADIAERRRHQGGAF